VKGAVVAEVWGEPFSWSRHSGVAHALPRRQLPLFPSRGALRFHSLPPPTDDDVLFTAHDRAGLECLLRYGLGPAYHLRRQRQRPRL